MQRRNFELEAYILLAAFMVLCAGVFVCTLEAQTIPQTREFSLHAWDIDSENETRVTVRFDAALQLQARRAFEAFRSAYAAGAYDVAFYDQVALTLADGRTVSATLHVSQFEDDTPALYFEYRTFERGFGMLHFTDSLTFAQIFGGN